MSSLKNRHGLARDIPEPIKLIIRQSSGFGCVVCGLGFYDYEHVDPEFNDATEHDPNRITLLCPNHHGDVTRNRLPKSEITRHMLNPAALKAGFSFGPLYYSGGDITVTMGDSVFTNVPYPIAVGGIPMISITPPEEDGPIQISAIMASTDGSPMLTIIKNEWRASVSKWDINTVGNRVTIRNGARNIGLRFRNDPGEGIVFERARIGFAGLRLDVGENGSLKFGMVGTSEFQEFSGMRATNCNTGFGIDLPPELHAAAKAWIKTQGAAFGIKDLQM